MSTKNWVPEIMYEEGGEDVGMMTSHIPFIPVPEQEEMPQLLYVFESRETGEFEPGPSGEDLPVTELELHQYADMNVLKEKLDLETYDKIRSALGLEPMKQAAKKGAQITNEVRHKIGQKSGVYPDGTKFQL